MLDQLESLLQLQQLSGSSKMVLGLRAGLSLAAGLALSLTKIQGGGE